MPVPRREGNNIGTLAYVDDFKLIMLIALASVPLLLLLREARRGPPPTAAVATAAADD